MTLYRIPENVTGHARKNLDFCIQDKVLIPVDIGEPIESDVYCVIHCASEAYDGVCWVAWHQNTRTPCRFEGRLMVPYDSEWMT